MNNPVHISEVLADVLKELIQREKCDENDLGESD